MRERELVAAIGLGVASIAAGCSCSSAHEIVDAASVDAAIVDAAPSDVGIDAATATDAFTSGAHYFTLEPASVDLIVTPERCSEREGATAMLRVTVHYFSSCDTPGPVDVVLDATAHTITIAPHVWREQGRTDCTAIGAAYVRDVTIHDLVAGTWSITGGSTSTSYVVDAPSPGPCPPPGTGTIAAGQMCAADCECVPGLSCLAVRGDAACARFCADPCEALGVGEDLSLSCTGGDACTDDPNLGWTCATAALDECGDTHACPAGMTCPPISEGTRQCVWAIELDGSVRHACTTQTDCDPGLDCVQRADGERRCEVRCTTSDMACPNNAPHACLPGNWVCEWLGE